MKTIKRRPRLFTNGYLDEAPIIAGMVSLFLIIPGGVSVFDGNYSLGGWLFLGGLVLGIVVGTGIMTWGLIRGDVVVPTFLRGDAVALENELMDIKRLLCEPELKGNVEAVQAYNALIEERNTAFEIIKPLCKDLRAGRTSQEAITQQVNLKPALQTAKEARQALVALRDEQRRIEAAQEELAKAERTEVQQQDLTSSADRLHDANTTSRDALRTLRDTTTQVQQARKELST